MNLLKFVKLDYRTIKPYLTGKNLLLIAGAALVMMIAVKNVTFVIGIIMMYGVMFASYPFATGEQVSLDTLYATLSVNRKTVVLGRYIFAFSLILACGAVSVAVSYIVPLFFSDKAAFEQLTSPVLIAVGCLFIYGLMQMIQLPIYFKLGYTKAKFVAYIPLLTIPLAVFGLSWAEQQSWGMAVAAFLNQHLVLLLAACVLLYLLLYALSISLSLKFYRRRDF